MAKTLIHSLEKAFDPAAFQDEYQARLKELIAQKIAGKEIVAPKSEESGNVIDLMEALKASIEQSAKPDKPKRSRKKTG